MQLLINSSKSRKFSHVPNGGAAKRLNKKMDFKIDNSYYNEKYFNIGFIATATPAVVSIVFFSKL